MEEDRADTYNSDRAADRLTIAEAATLLGVHKNTIRNRIKDGTYKAEKVITERGPTYLIERESLLTNLSTNALPSASQQLVNPQAMEFVQELLRPFVNELGEVREELGAERARRAIERARRQVAEERIRDLEAELEALREQAAQAREVAPELRETPETAADEQQGRGPIPDAGGPQEAGEPPFMEEQPERQGFWRKLFGG